MLSDPYYSKLCYSALCFIIFFLQLNFLSFKYIIQISHSLKGDYHYNQNSSQNYTWYNSNNW